MLMQIGCLADEDLVKTYRHGGEDVVDVPVQAGIDGSWGPLDDDSGPDPREVAAAVICLSVGTGRRGLHSKRLSQGSSEARSRGC